MSADHVVIAPDGTAIAAWRSGTGPPLVLVHGTTGDHTSWRLLAPHLALNFMVFAIDRRGRGESPWNGPVYTIEQEFDDVAAVVDSIGSPAWLLGHSYGADVAVGAALRTRNLAGLILYEPAPGLASVPGGELEAIEALLAAGERDAAMVRILSAVVDIDDATIATIRADPSWSTRLATVDTVPRELRAEETLDPGSFRDVVMPTLLIEGSESPDWAKKGTAVTQATVRGSRLQVLEGEGHVAHLTAPERLARLVVDFAFDPSRS